MKRIDGYELNITQNADILQFKFTSEGDNGFIKKIVEFSQIRTKVWNLGFGDVVGND
jgi:hypothetical protein